MYNLLNDCAIYLLFCGHHHVLYAFALTGRYGFFVFQLPRVSLRSALGYVLAALSGRSRIRGTEVNLRIKGTCPYNPFGSIPTGVLWYFGESTTVLWSEYCCNQERSTGVIQGRLQHYAVRSTGSIIPVGVLLITLKLHLLCYAYLLQGVKHYPLLLRR